MKSAPLHGYIGNGVGENAHAISISGGCETEDAAKRMWEVLCSRVSHLLNHEAMCYTTAPFSPFSALDVQI